MSTDTDPYPDADAPYYRLYLSHRSDKITVVCMQYFDEYDYVDHRFLKDDKGERLKFRTEPEAIVYLNKNIPRPEIDPEYQNADGLRVHNDDSEDDDLLPEYEESELHKCPDCGADLFVEVDPDDDSVITLKFVRHNV